MKKIIITIMLVANLWGADSFIIKDIGAIEDYHFPYFIAKDKKKKSVAENINIYLHLNYLELLPKSYKKNPFEMVNRDKGMPRLIVYSFEIEQKAKFISVYMQMEGCGAYCEEFDTRKIFLTQNGQIVTAKSLFTKQGLKEFNNINHKNIQKTIKQFLKNKIDKEQRELYDNCLERDYTGKIFEYSNFSIDKDRFTIYSERCSNHAMRALDDIGDFSNSYSFKEIKSYLSLLGKYLLDKHQKHLPNREIVEGVYSGKIAHKYPIKLFIQEVNDDGSLGAYYWYEKYQQPIDLGGNYRDKKLKLYFKKYDEEQEKWIKVESFIGDLKHGKFKGIWENLQTDKGFDVRLNKK